MNCKLGRYYTAVHHNFGQLLATSEACEQLHACALFMQRLGFVLWNKWSALWNNTSN